MLAVQDEEWPEIGDLVMATIERITPHGAYVLLDEYNKEGLLHISEISSSWVRNIRNFVRERQKVVLKVLRVDPKRRHVDVSLRRVSGPERKEKVFLWKKGKTAESLLRSASEKLKIPLKEIYEKAGNVIEKEFGIYEGLEKTVKEGSEVLLKLGIPKEIAVVLTEIANQKIRIPMVKIKGTLELQCAKPNGAKLIQEALLNAQNIEMTSGSKVNIHVVASPKYNIEVVAENYKEAEKILKKVTEVAIKNITKSGGQGSFKRKK
jgi:translation initiation factor 2 subunit 1